jgi:hypothetical protein
LRHCLTSCFNVRCVLRITATLVPEILMPARTDHRPPEPFGRTSDSSAADAGSAGVGRYGQDRELRQIEIIIACAAGRISVGEWS